MRALIRYLYLKHLREGWLYGFVLGPALLVLTPYTVFVAGQLLRGRWTWPLPASTGLHEALKEFPEVMVFVCALAATVAAFYGFAREATNRSIGSIILAVRPHTLVLSAGLFATVGALVSFAVASGVFALIRSTFDGGATAVSSTGTAEIMLKVVLVFAACASTGVAMMSISAVPTMMLPAYVITLWTAAWQSDHFGGVGAAVAIAQIAIMLTTAIWFTRRRCAA